MGRLHLLGGLWIAAQLLAWCQPGAADGDEWRAAVGPLTVTSALTLGEPGAGEDEIWLAGLAGDPDGAPTAIALRWVEKTAGWFPSWELQLAADRGRLPQALIDGADGDLEWITFASNLTSPHRRRYRARLSYDPLQSTLAFQLHDVSQGEDVYAAEIRLERAAALHPPGDEAVRARYSHVESVVVEPGYVALGLPLPIQRGFTWELVELVNGIPQERLGFEFPADAVPGIRVAWPRTQTPGAVWFAVLHDGEEIPLASAEWSASPQVFPISPEGLPWGDSLLRAVYVEGGREAVIGESRLRRVRARINVTWEMMGRAPGRGLAVRALLSSDRDLGEVPFRIQAQFTQAGQEGSDPVTTTDEKRLALPANEPVGVVFEIPLPPVAGRIHLQGESLPGILVQGGLGTFSFSAPPPVWVTPVHPHLTTVIGEPAVLPPGEPYPALEISANRSGTLRGEVVSGGVTIARIPERAFQPGEPERVPIAGTPPGPGLYEIQLEIEEADGRRVAYDALYFTVADARGPEPGTSRIAYLRDEGKLVYVPDYRGNRIADFSHSGYMGGGVRIPDVAVKAVVEPGDGDDRERIQAAIDEVARLPLDEHGRRGAVLLRKGRYEIDGSIHITAGGIVLRGEGDGEDGTVLVATGRESRDLIIVRGSGAASIMPETAQTIADLYVPVGGRTFRVVDASGFAVGDTIIIRRHGNADWIHEIGMDRITPRPGNPESTMQWSPFDLNFERVITAIDGRRITVDAPIVNAIETQWGGGQVFKATDRRIEQVGVESLRGVSEFDERITCSRSGVTYFCDESHGSRLVHFDQAKNAWARDLTAVNFQHGPVYLGRGTKWITVQDASSLDPVSTIDGGRRYPFQNDGQLNLMHRVYSEKARHAFSFGSRVTGTNVFLHAVAREDYATSEPHHRWSVGGLFDNVQAPIAIQDRQWYGSGHGWAGANYVAWNTEGELVVQKPPTAQNWAIGHVGEKQPGAFAPREDGYWESLGVHVRPRSLYLQQLADRLGPEAVVAIGYAVEDLE